MSDELESPGKPTLAVEADVFRLSWPCGIEAELERFSEHGDELKAEVTIRSRRPPKPGLIHSARENLMSTRARRDLATALADRDPNLDWTDLVGAMCFLVRERYRAGEPAIDLREHEPSPLGRWLLEPFVERDGPTVLFADGGTGKSMLALAIGISVASGHRVVGALHGDPRPVLYLDWETDPDTVQERLDAILSGAELLVRPAMHYRRMATSLMEASGELRREIARLGVGFVIVDSLGSARAGEPESADVTIRLFNAARSLGVPWLGVDHVTKANGNDSTRPFGSTYTHNSARMTWGLDKAQEEGAGALAIALTNRKRNNGRLLPRIAYRLQFENGPGEELLAVRYERVDPSGEPGLAEKGPLRERIIAELRAGPRPQADLAEALGVRLEQLTARTSEMVKRGQLVKLDDRRVALTARVS